MKNTLKSEIMNTDELKGKVDQLMGQAEELKGKAEEFINSDAVQDKVAQAKDWIQNGQGKEYLDKGKEFLGNAKDKLEDFVEDKTDGKGIFGFGAKED